MKNFIIAMFFCIAVLGCSTPSKLFAEPVQLSAKVSPQLFLQPAYIFDQMCELSTGFKIEPAIQSEFMQKSESFQSEWDKWASDLITNSQELAGRQYFRKEYSVALTLCRWVPMGDPAFIVSVRPYLGEARKDKDFQLPFSMTHFVSMTQHELLHSLVDNIVNEDFFKSSTLLNKYQAEPFNVQVHLHLMALQMAVNQKIGNTEMIKATDDLYNYIGNDYGRVWEIIKIEGFQKFVDELKDYNTKIK